MRFALLFLLCSPCIALRAEPLVIGSKNFTESYLLAEIAAQLLESHGVEIERRLGLNGTRISFEALRNDAIDLYPEYSGTISEVILAEPELSAWDELRAAMAAFGVVLLPPLGFDNTYAIAVTREIAERHGLAAISDLRGMAALRVAFPHETLNRQDGGRASATATTSGNPCQASSTAWRTRR